VLAPVSDDVAVDDEFSATGNAASGAIPRGFSVEIVIASETADVVSVGNGANIASPLGFGGTMGIGASGAAPSGFSGAAGIGASIVSLLGCTGSGANGASPLGGGTGSGANGASPLGLIGAKVVVVVVVVVSACAGAASFGFKAS